MKRFLSLLAFASVLLFSAAPVEAQSWSNTDSLVANLESEMEGAEGKSAPSFQFQPLGKEKAETLSDYAGQTVVVNFWNTNCSGSTGQLPDLSKLQEAYADQGLNVIYISSQDESAVRRFWEEKNIAGSVARMSRQDLSRPFQFVATPSAFVVGPSGKVRETWLGPETFEQLEARIKPYLTSR
jgi:peroxiredoxin